ncbi:MAG: class I SAM-dependent methyltransferase [Actinobacteria bacterium]|nr:class I SAM-dependent methyltransferase [Actinomycetota bacterium]
MRPDLIPYLKVEGATVLDVGCGAGGLAPLLRERGARRIVGVEVSDLAIDAAKVCDEVHRGSVEEVLQNIDESFDFVITADVLEHLVDPWSVLRELRPHVKQGGSLLVSIPNVSHLTVLLQLLFRRDWRFDDAGIFDRTHLRWFGRHTLNQMLDEAGFEPTTWAANVSLGLGRRWDRGVGPVKTRWVPAFFVLQWIVVARPVDTGVTDEK